MASDLDKILISHEQHDFPERLANARLEMKKAARFSQVSEEYGRVMEIIRDVSKRKDAAVAEYTKKFDGVTLNPQEFRIGADEMANAHRGIDAELLEAIRKAIANVRNYQTRIFVGRDQSFESTAIRYTPIRRVGICIPGASAPLPSTVVMTVVPAQVAGVKEIAVVSPPRHEGTIHPVILAVCHELGITEVYRIGGVQAVAALVMGTPTIPQVSKIVGPGNQWVQTAKKFAASDSVGIDSIAGPSEVLIIADDRANPAYVAADMLSQAEHAPGSATVFTDSKPFANKLLLQLKEQVTRLARKDATVKCLMEFSLIAVFENIEKAIASANDFAPEHLEIQCGDESRAIADRIENAGAIFIGEWSPVAVGDYWAGPSHTLPTGMTAKFASALTSNDFVKSISIIEYDRKKLAASAEDIIRLAEAEGLDAHARSVRIRLQR